MAQQIINIISNYDPDNNSTLTKVTALKSNYQIQLEKIRVLDEEITDLVDADDIEDVLSSNLLSKEFLLMKKSLKLFEDNKNLFRVCGRLSNSDFNYQEKYLQAMSGDACDCSRTRWHTRKIFCQCDLSHAQDFVLC